MYYAKLYIDGEYITTFKTYEDYHSYVQRVDLSNVCCTFEYGYEQED